jgi:hypothetical protein
LNQFPLETLNSRIHRPFFSGDLGSVFAKFVCQMSILGEPLDCVRHHLRLMLHEKTVYTIDNGFSYATFGDRYHGQPARIRLQGREPERL